MRCGWSVDSASTPRHRLECARDPTSRNAFWPHPQSAGGFASSSQSNWVSTPGGCSIGAFGRPFAGLQASHGGRSPRARSWRVNVG